MGIMLAEDADNPVGTHFATAGLDTNASNPFYVDSALWDSYNNHTSSPGFNIGAATCYVRIDYVAGNTFHFFSSVSGVDWCSMGSVASTFVPKHAGLFVVNEQPVGGHDAIGIFEFYRVHTPGTEIDSGLFRGARCFVASSSGGGIVNNFTAVVDPTVNDDSLLGYQVGSQWANTVTETYWVCINATPGAALWLQFVTGP